MNRVLRATTIWARISRRIVAHAATLLLALFAFFSALRTRKPIIRLTLFILLSSFFLLSPPASAAPTTMNFQGRLLDTTGTPVADGLYNMQFKLYDASSGGTLLWSEIRENNGSDYRVQVTNGLFTTKLGQRTALSASLFSGSSVYFEITQATPATATCNTASCATWESPMAPRHQLSTSAYAFNSETLDGLDSTDFAAASGSGSYIQNTTSPQTANFTLSGTGTATYLQAQEVGTPSGWGSLIIGNANTTDITISDNTTLAPGMSLTLSGGNTASRPASPTEGMVYYDTTTKQLLTYANGKWQADSKTATVIVAASNSPQAVKDGAQYLATGTNDQTQINAAIAALPAIGGKVYLAEGTYNLSAAVSLSTANTVLTGSGKASILKRMYNEASASGLVNLNADSTTVSFIAVDGNKSTYTNANNYGIYMSASFSGEQVISDAKVYNTAGYGIAAVDTSAYNAYVGRNEVTGATLCGIRFDHYSIRARVYDNTVNSNGGGGICVVEGELIISGNSVASNTGTGISSAQSAVQDNVVKSNTGTGIILAGGSATGNYVTNNNVGISTVDWGSEITISSNTIASNTTYGIYIATQYVGQRNQISSNIFANNGSSGIYFDNAVSNANIDSNTFTNNGGSSSASSIDLNVYGGGSNRITNNVITDTAGTGYAIKLIGSSNYLSGNTFSGTGASSINDAGTGTIYAGQSKTQGGLDIAYKQANSTTAFRIQNANSVNLLTADTTNSQLLLGSYNAGTNPLAGKLVIANDTNANTVTLQTGTTSSSYSLVLPTAVGTTGQCLSTTVSGSTSTLGWSGCSGGVTLQGGTPGTADVGNFNVNGVGILGTAVYSPIFDRASAGTLTIGGSSATTLNIANNNAAHTINIGAGGTSTAQTITIGSTSSTSALTLQAGDNPITFNRNSTFGDAFVFQVAATPVFYIDTYGRVVFHTTSNSSPTFRITDQSNAEMLSIDTVIGLTTIQNVLSYWSLTAPYLTLGSTSGGGSPTSYTTPQGSSVATRINVTNSDVGSFNQVVALGLPSTNCSGANSGSCSARVLSLFDARTNSHQPTISVFNPAEGDVVGLSWEPDNAAAYNTNAAIKTIGGSSNISIKPGNNTVLRTFSTYNVRIGNTTDNNPADPNATLQVQDDVAPASVLSNGTNAKRAFGVQGQTGGATTGTTGQTAGTGGDVWVQGGQGGNAPGGSTNGAGGNITLSAGAAGAGAGTAGTAGKVLVKNQANSTTAFQIQNTASTSLFTADTTGMVISVSGTTSTFATLTLDNAHFKSTQTNAPTIGTPSTCGTSPTAAVGTGSTDAAGSFHITAGTGSPGTCSVVITFDKAYGAAPKSIIVSPQNKDGGTAGTAAAKQIYISGSGTSTFTVTFGVAPAASEVNWFYYWVVE